MSSELFSEATRTRLYAIYKNRCAICLVELPEFDAHCVDILDTEAGPTNKRPPLAPAVAMGFVKEGYELDSVDNGIVQCPTCHLAFFAPGFTLLSPAKEVLRWYRNYLQTTYYKDRKPLHEIHSMISRGQYDGLPDVTPMLPFLSLYSVIVPKPPDEDRHRIPTSSLPGLSVLRVGAFAPAPPRTSPSAPDAARIFDVRALPSEAPAPVVLGQIPLAPASREFAQRRLWRLPVAFPVVMSAFTFFAHTLCVLGPEVEEVRLARNIRYRLEEVMYGWADRLHPGPGDGGGSDDEDERGGNADGSVAGDQGEMDDGVNE